MSEIDDEIQDPEQGGTPEGGKPAGAKGDDAAERLAKMERENEELKKQNQNLTNEKATVERRLEEVQTPRKPAGQTEAEDLIKRTTQILADAQLDPEKAGKDLAQLLTQATTDAEKNAISKARTELDQDTQWNKHVEKVKAENSDLTKYEKRIARDAGLLLSQGKAKSAEDALEKAISEFRTEFNLPKPNATPAPKNEAPKGSQGESGGSENVPREKAKNNAPDADDESPESYVAMRKKLVATKGA